MSPEHGALRRATGGDRDELLPLLRAFSDHFGFSWDEERKVAVLERLLARPDLGRVWLLTRGGRGAGYAVVVLHLSLEFNGSVALLDEFWISPGFRGGGLGSLALARIAAELAGEGIKILRLEVDDRHREAVGLYERCGFVRELRGLWSRRISG